MLSDEYDMCQKTMSINAPVFFNICDDVEQIKEFYTDVLGLKETAYSENTYIEYVKDGKTMMFYQNNKVVSKLSGKNKDTNKPFNWCIKADSDLFLRVFKVLNNKPPAVKEGYLTLDISDPMNNNIVVYLEAEKALKKA